MKKVLALLLTAFLTFGLLCACGEPTEEGNEGAPGTDSAKELVSKVRYTSSYENDGETRESELVMDFTWTENGAIMEGYELSGDEKNEVRMEAVLDDQKRPLTITKFVKDGDETEESKVEFSYPSKLQVKMTTTYSEDSMYVAVYDYDENGNLIREARDNYTRGYAYDAHGNCTRTWMDYTDEETEDWERTTVYTYDDSGKAIYAVETQTNSDTEEQAHYYYYPNGNVMCIMYVTSHGDTNFGFRPYNTKDTLAWGYGMGASGGHEYEVEKDARGYITKVVRKGIDADDVQTATFEYDEKGNLIKEVSFSGTIFTWEYDAQNRPVKCVENQQQTAKKTVYTTVYEYDTQGRLVAQKKNGTNGASDINTWAYNEAGMTTAREEKRVSIYDDGHVVSEQKMQVEYVENAKCAVSQEWAMFFLQNFVSGL